MPVATTGKWMVMWNEARWVVHDTADDKWFGKYSRALGRYVFQDGRETDVKPCERDDAFMNDASFWKNFSRSPGALPCPHSGYWIASRDTCPINGVGPHGVPFDGIPVALPKLAYVKAL